jgi:uncharacterized protein
MTAMFVNLPVTDLERAKAFYTAIGFTINPTFTDHNAAIFFDTREAVDVAVADGLAAGGAEARPATDYGFMYQRQLTDPDGNILEFGYMDPVAAEQGPEAFANQQG